MRNTLIALLALSLFGCSEEPVEDSAPQGLVEIPGGFGKGDNYIATNAKEFMIRGSARTALPTGYAELEVEEQEATLSELVSSRTGDITRCGSGFECITLFEEPELFYIPKQCVATGSTCG